MDMILGAINCQSWRLECAEDLGHIRMEFHFNLRRNERFAVFGAENEVDEDRRQGLRHVLVSLSLFRAFSAFGRTYDSPGPLAQAITFRAFGAEEILGVSFEFLAITTSQNYF